MDVSTDIIAPWTTSWTGEERLFVAPCRYAGGSPAICQPHARGQGKPLFATPHSVRQRQAIICGLCDLCGVKLGPVKVSLSFERRSDVGLIQAEPLSHPHCAVIACQNCPHLKRHIETNTVWIREIEKYRTAVAKLTAAAVMEFTGEKWRDGAVCGHAKIIVDRFIERDYAWLLGIGGSA